MTVQTIAKEWGREEIWAATALYTGKFLIFDTGAASSKHWHAIKEESWFIQSGLFRIEVAERENVYGPGETVHLPPGTIHRVDCIESGTIIEVSTAHTDEDVYRLGRSRSATEKWL